MTGVSRYLLVLGLSAAGLAACQSSATEPPSPRASKDSVPAEVAVAKTPGASFSLVTYNINAGMSGEPTTLAAIGALDADIIVLQEVTPVWLKKISKHHTTTHPHRDTFIDPRHHYGGLAVLSRFPIREGEVLRDGPGPFAAWRGLVDTPAGVVQLVNVHLFPPVVWFRERGIMKAYRDSQARHKKELEAHLSNVDADLPTVIAGDFNENRLGKAITWLRKQGFTPALEQIKNTWRWRVRDNFDVEFELDHIMLRRIRSLDGDVLDVGRSDHRPVTATLALVE